MSLTDALRNSAGIKGRAAFGMREDMTPARRPRRPAPTVVRDLPPAPPALDDPASRRHGKRKSGAIPCIVSFRGLRMALPCRIIDMSVGGACLQLPQAAKSAYDGDVASLPNELTLHLKVDHMEYDGQIVWRAKDRVGIRFSGPPRIMR